MTTIYSIGILNHNTIHAISGFYVPLTMADNIIVDGVLASCFGSFDHDLAHIAMKPMQWFPEIVQWIFGEDNGNPLYVEIDETFGEWILPLGHFYGKK